MCSEVEPNTQHTEHQSSPFQITLSQWHTPTILSLKHFGISSSCLLIGLPGMRFTSNSAPPPRQNIEHIHRFTHPPRQCAAHSVSTNTTRPTQTARWAKFPVAHFITLGQWYSISYNLFLKRFIYNHCAVFKSKEKQFKVHTGSLQQQ